MNWVRCVSSCRHTQRRKSCGLTPSSRSTMTIFGATRVSRPAGATPFGAPGSGGRNSSYCPSTRLARYARISPACTPVTREPTAVTTEPPGAFPRSRRCSASGSRTTRNPSTLARIQPGRSTIATQPLPSSPGPDMPVTARTGSDTVSARARSSATTARASPRLTWGPGRAHLTPVEMARSQSIICPLLTPPPYVLRGGGGACRAVVHRLRHPQPASAEAIRSRPSAARPRLAGRTWSVMNAKASTRPLAS